MAGEYVYNLQRVTKSHGKVPVITDLTLAFYFGAKIGVIGGNGAGKSTLLRLIMGSELPAEGLAQLGEHNVVAGYFEQNQAEALDLSKTVIDTLFEAVPDWTQTQVRSLLGSFCFSNDAVFKEVGKLSGGEKQRVAIARALLKDAPILFCDEVDQNLLFRKRLLPSPCHRRRRRHQHRHHGLLCFPFFTPPIFPCFVAFRRRRRRWTPRRRRL